MIKEQALNGGSLKTKTPGSFSSLPIPNSRIEILRQRLNDENYIHAAVQRLALIMSRQLMEITKEGGCYEQQQRQ